MSEMSELRKQVTDVQGDLQHLIGKVEATFEHLVTRDTVSELIEAHINKCPHKNMSKKAVAGIIGAITALTGALSAIANALMN